MNFDLYKRIGKITKNMLYTPKPPTQLPIGFLSPAPTRATEPIIPAKAMFFMGGTEEFLNWVRNQHKESELL